MPLSSFLENSDIDIQFCICWANERLESQVGRRKQSGPDRPVALCGRRRGFSSLCKKYFDDPRYLKVDGRPILTVYRPAILPDARETVARWRSEAAAMGLPGLYLVATNSFGFSDAKEYGFDSLSEFPPHGVKPDRCEVKLLTPQYTGAVYSYASFLSDTSRSNCVPVWPGVMPDWDNTPRNPKKSYVVKGSTPTLFRTWLDKSIARARENPVEARFVMINAWNEWAEGAYLEPDRRSGYAYLAACGSAITDNSPIDGHVAVLLASTRERFLAQHPLACILHLYYEDMAEEFARKIHAFGSLDIYLTVPKDISYETARQIAELFPRAYVLPVENRGRDMLPFLTVLDAVRTGNYQFVCKLHSKRSGHRGDGDLWREELVTSLLSPAAGDMLQRAATMSKMGVLASKGSLASLEIEEIRRTCTAPMEKLAAKAGIKISFRESFVAGSMFWFRPEAMAWFSRLASAADFEPELGQLDGTIAHALERMTIIAARAAGYDVLEIEGDMRVARAYASSKSAREQKRKTSLGLS